MCEQGGTTGANPCFLAALRAWGGWSKEATGAERTPCFPAALRVWGGWLEPLSLLCSQWGPVKPVRQVHSPLMWSQLAPFWHWHRRAQSFPKKAAGQPTETGLLPGCYACTASLHELAALHGRRGDPRRPMHLCWYIPSSTFLGDAAWPWGLLRVPRP